MRTPLLAALALSSVTLAIDSAFAQPARLDTVVISGQRTRENSFDVPAAITAIDRETLDSAGPQVNLSEALNRVPGLTVLNRQNYAQDLQLSIRGFGSRSTFGIRGVRVIVDGIPATMPDGQGQASNIALATAGRIEVLRGPLAQLYGNAAGGVVQIFTQDDAERPTIGGSVSAGPYGQRRVGATFSGRSGAQGLTFDASQYETDGWRPHSAARRGLLNARWQIEASSGTKVSVVLNALDQSKSEDPLGLTRAQWEADPRQTPAIAITQDARKSVRQQQLGSVVEQKLGEATTLTGRIYAGQRDLDNALSTPLAAQTPPTSSGGMVQFARSYVGAGLQLAHRVALDGGRSLRLTGGVELDRMREDRQGYLNNAGQQGALKRNELNTVDNRDLFVQGAFDVAPQWTVTAGARHSEVRFRSADRFIATGNPDDSGGVDYAATNPVLGLAWRAAPSLNLYANVGRGFETPTFTELSYRPVGTGLNTALRASRSRHSEVGAKWKYADDARLDVALFDIATRDEIVVDTNNGGRSTFKNAGRTERRGIELSNAIRFTPTLRSQFSATWLRARFADGFTSGAGAAAVNIPAGNRLPGTPERNLFVDLAWTPGGWAGFETAVEVVHVGRLYVSDTNEDAAPAATVFNLRAGWSQKLGAWRLSQLVRLDNAGNRRYAGSVIVNEGNKRFFEPALPRNWLLAFNAKYEFQ